MWGKTYDIWVVRTGKVTWKAYGSVTYKDSSGKEVTEHVEDSGRSESAAIRGWAARARIVMDY